MKCANGQPVTLAIDDEMQRLYVGTKEGILLILDISKKDPLMVHYMQMVPSPSPNGQNYIKQMDLDKDRNILICRMNSSRIYCIQLIPGAVKKSTIIEKVDTYHEMRNLERDFIAKFKWLARMSCYVEGTNRGYMKIRDVQNEGESFLRLNTGFSDKVCCLEYNRDKNVLFAACRDGKFLVWKVPHEWRQKWVDKKEQEAEFERRTKERERRMAEEKKRQQQK